MPFDPESDVGRAFLYYIENRARVWAEKYIDGRPPDYRGDYVLERYHFCNVWRELDRYSKWEIASIRGRPLQEQVDLIMVGRMTMIPATVSLLMSGTSRDVMFDYVERRRAAGLPWFNGALQTSASAPGRGYMDEFVDHRDSYYRNRSAIMDVVAEARTAQEITNGVAPLLRRVGPFRAYEIATSMTYSEHLHRLDEEQLFIVGPGAIDGLAFVTGEALGARSSGHSDKAMRPAFEALRDAVVASLINRGVIRWIPPRYQGSPLVRRRRKFTLRTLEDSLCEFRKYYNIVTGAKKARRTHRDLGDITA